ncbi:hypothetical protein [Vibrio sp. 10N.239.312.D08]|uniref:hypothetical protein n=1 Tax=Vibrio sp. 10N.239.312.D08 TaxID=3229978 RepID=UPI00354F7774
MRLLLEHILLDQLFGGVGTKCWFLHEVKMPNYENDDLNIGNLGEHELSIWCTKARLKVNRSLEEDSTGWDHLIRFPYEETLLPKDLQSKPIECKVQVKTTFRGDKKGVSIKLSALKHLVDDTSPAFILFFEFSNKHEPVLDNAYLVHLGEGLITSVLMRIREEHLSIKPKKLNQIKLWVSYNDSHKLEQNSGYALRDKIASFVPDGIVEYQKKKNELTNTVGYGDNGYIIQFQAKLDDMEQHFLNAAIGISSSVDVTNSILKDNRFDLADGAVEVKNSEIAKIEVFPNVIDECQLRFKTSAYSPAMVFDGEFVKMPHPTTLQNILYLRTKLFSVELRDVSNLKAKSNLHFTFDKAVALDEAIKLFKLFSPEYRGKNLIFEVALKKENRVIKMNLTLDNTFEDTATIIDSISILKSSYEIDGNTLTTVDDLFNQRIALSALAAIIKNNVESIRFKQRREPSSNEFVTEPEITIPYAMTVQIGSYYVGVVALLEGHRVSDIDYQAKNAEILETLTFYGDAPTEELLDEITNDVLHKKIGKDESEQSQSGT